MNARKETEDTPLMKRVRRSYLEGMLCAIVLEGVDLGAATRELDELLMSRKYRYNEMEKIALGYIATIVEKDVPREQLVAIACKIRDFYEDHT